MSQRGSATPHKLHDFPIGVYEPLPIGVCSPDEVHESTVQEECSYLEHCDRYIDIEGLWRLII